MIIVKVFQHLSIFWPKSFEKLISNLRKKKSKIEHSFYFLKNQV